MTKTMLLLATMFALPTAATAGTLPAPDSRITLAAGACQTALPVFDGVVRKRPLAVQNEGSTTTFVTCGLSGKFGGSGPSTTILVALTNNSSGPATVNCTLVDGRSGISNPIYLPKSVTLSANMPIFEMIWTVADNEGARFTFPAISCSLPPGTGIKAVGQQFPAPAA